MRAVETTPAAPLKAVTDEELSSDARSTRVFEDRPDRPLKRKGSAQLRVIWSPCLQSKGIAWKGIVRSEDEMYYGKT